MPLWQIPPITLLILLGWGSTLSAQTEAGKYRLPRRTVPIEKALIKLNQAGADLSYRPDQIPKQTIKLPGGLRTLDRWLNFLLRGTELTFEATPAGYLIYPDPDLRSRSFNLYGMVSDAESGERLIGAALQTTDAAAGTASNEYGFYSLTVPGGRQRLRVSYIGYESREMELVVRGDTLLNLALDTDGTLPAIIVRAGQPSDDPDVYLRQTRTGIGREEVGRLGGPGGEADPLRVARLLPGVETGADGLGGIFIRGGEAGHNLVLLDGVPVYNLNHAAGLFSIFSNQAIRRVDLYKDGVPARFGGRIGGVLDVHTRDGNRNNYALNVGSSLLASHFTAEGPLKNKESSFLVTGRYFWAGDIVRSASRAYKRRLGRDGQMDYQVYDVNFKLNQKMGRRGRLYLSLYKGVDDYENFASETDSLFVLSPAGAIFQYATPSRRRDAVRWGNTVGALRYNHLFSERLFGNFRLSYSDLSVNAAYERTDSLIELTNDIRNGDAFSGRYLSDIRQVGVAFDGQYAAGGGLEVRFGVEGNLHRFLPQLRSGAVELSRQPRLREPLPSDFVTPRQVVTYASLSGQFKGIQFSAGTRVQWWGTGGSGNYWHVVPRLLVAGRMDAETTWRITYDGSVQPVHLVSSTVIGLPSDLWVPATGNLAPATAAQLAGQLTRAITDRTRLEFATYYRRMDGLVEYNEGGLQDEWLNTLGQGNGWAGGAELTLNQNGERFQGWVTYSVADSRRQFDDRINLGRPFSFRYARRNSIKAVGTWMLNPRVTLSASWRFGSGARYSLSAETFLFVDPAIEDGEDVPTRVSLVNERNGFRLPANHRLDVNAQFRLGNPNNERFSHRLDVGLYNVYNRKNPVYYEVRTNYRSRDEQLVADRQFVQVYLAPFMPTLAYHLSFRGGKSKE